MVLRAHRVPGMANEDVPSPGQVLRIATSGGAATTPFGSHIGTLAVGKVARPGDTGNRRRPPADAYAARVGLRDDLSGTRC